MRFPTRPFTRGVTLLLCLASSALADAFKAEPGFISLYNEKDLTGWRYLPEEKFDGKTESSDGRYTARGETLVVNPQNPDRGPRLRQLYTTREFPQNFTLKLQFRAAVDADSGIFIRKPQLQCRDYLVAGPYKQLKQYKPQDWNQIEVVVKDGVARATCNGEVLEEALKLPETGPIGLEADRGQMEYRHIQIKISDEKVAKPAPPPRKPEDAATPAKVNEGRQKAFLERAKDKSIQLVFLGDSITDFWLRADGNHGKEVWDQYYAKYNAANFGVSGEHTEHTLGHIAGGVLDGLNPKAVVLMIGTNNIGHVWDEKPEWVAGGIQKIVETVHAKLPATKVLLLAIFPRGTKSSDQRKSVEAVNKLIANLDDGKKTRFLDLTAKFTDASGEIPKDIMPDLLHPNTKGYQIWAESMQPLLDELMK